MTTIRPPDPQPTEDPTMPPAAERGALGAGLPVGPLSHLRCPRCERVWLAEGDWSDGYPSTCPYCHEARPGVLGVHRAG